MTGPAMRGRAGGSSLVFAEDFVRTVRDLGLGDWTAELSTLPALPQLQFEFEVRAPTALCSHCAAASELPLRVCVYAYRTVLMWPMAGK